MSEILHLLEVLSPKSEVLIPMSAIPLDEPPVMISALQHYLFCPRQCALIHLEGAWCENFLTASGRQLHERVDRRAGETRREVHLATALRLVSQRLGLTGVADMVEFHMQGKPQDGCGKVVAAKLPGRKGWWRPFPVEYKRGAPKSHRADEVQLCAQGMCLEEMLGVGISAGALFYGETRRRVDVQFDSVLRALTEDVSGKVRNLLRSGETPPPAVSKGCRACSLLDICRPHDVGGVGGKSARRWIDIRIGEAIA